MTKEVYTITEEKFHEMMKKLLNKSQYMRTVCGYTEPEEGDAIFEQDVIETICEYLGAEI